MSAGMIAFAQSLFWLGDLEHAPKSQSNDTRCVTLSKKLMS